MSRGHLLAREPSQAFDALSDCNAAIDIMKQLRDEIKSQFPDEWKHDLAKALMNRALLSVCDPSKTIDSMVDFNAAIGIIKQLRNKMKSQFPPEWKNDLSTSYYRFASYLLSSDKEYACQLFLQAFHLASSLHHEFGDDMPGFWMQTLEKSEKSCQDLGLLRGA